MKATVPFLVLGLLVLGMQSHAEISTTNTILTADAAKIAAQLRVGMSEQATATFLKSNGITQNLGTNVYSLSVGCSHGWTMGYPLADGHSLDLDFRPGSIRPDGWWGGDGLLERVGIRSHGVDVVSIALTNAEPDDASNRSQPIRSDTNRTSSAAGSRR